MNRLLLAVLNIRLTKNTNFIVSGIFLYYQYLSRSNENILLKVLLNKKIDQDLT